ncbi:hypothetical protein PGT21_026427 [Puccinia graminis f. sp. tritici]|uniref:Uncharacterized protein n=2 Tax=Puccinia graminis f. sp. tritici TaxID=56615 RepID=A0A5B0MFR3_PUCGR|nr:hypothetical protein PGT21_026427 [Puccinia graminis f. sp. tritici]
MKSKTGEMAMDLETLRLSFQHTQHLIQSDKAIDLLQAYAKLYSKENRAKEGNQLIQNGEALLNRGKQIVPVEAAQRIQNANKLLEDAPVFFNPLGNEGDILDEETIRRSIEHGILLTATGNEHLEQLEKAQREGTQVMEAANRMIEEGQNLVNQGQIKQQRESETLEKVGHLKQEKSTLMGPLDQVIQTFDLLKLGSRMQVFEKLSDQEKANLMKQGKEVSNHHLTDLPDEISKQVPPEVWKLVQKIKRKDDERLKGLSFQGVCESLNEVMHSLGPIVTIKIGDDFDKSFIKRGLMLQKNILEMVNYMHRYGFITTKAFKSFFASKHTIEIAAITMFSSLISHTMLWNSYHTTDYVLLVRELPSYGTYIIQVLDEENKAMLSYSYLKTIFSYCEQLNFPMKKALEEGDTSNQHFAMARDHVFLHSKFIGSLQKYLQAKLRSPSDTEEFQRTAEFDEMERTIRYILSVFVLVGDQPNIQGKEWQLRSLFILIKLIESQFGKELITRNIVDEGFKKRYQIMAERFQFFEEIDQLKLYMQDKQGKLPVPGSIQYSDELQQKGISPLDHITNHYIPSMFSNNIKRITKIVQQQEPLDDRPSDNYYMLEKDVLENKLVQLEIGNALARLDKKKPLEKEPSLKE